ncbi:putative lipopolysaccharide heptosyltransferase III [Nitrospira sp. Nam74]
MKNLLIIKLRYIGDVLLATPVLRALRERFPDARLTMAVNRGTEDVIKWNPYLNDLIIVERDGLAGQIRLLHQLRRRRFDAVIDLTDGDRSALLTRASGAPVRIGFNEELRWRGMLYSTIVRSTPGSVHRLERDLAALRPLGIEPKASPLILRTSAEDEHQADRLLKDVGVMNGDGHIPRPLVLFHPGARYWFKSWPLERFSELADRLTDEHGCRILLGGGIRDVEAVRVIYGRAQSSPIVLAGRATLLQFAAVLKRCALFVGNDNGAMHMAAALGTPLVGLFGPSNPLEWGPRGQRMRVIYKELDCRRCFHPTCFRGEESCMRRISVDEVMASCRSLTVLDGHSDKSRTKI